MRTIPYGHPHNLPELGETVAIPWMEIQSPVAKVLENVDALLEKHGLEIVVLTSRSATFEFRIEKRQQ
jgi:hypothetical protein